MATAFESTGRGGGVIPSGVDLIYDGERYYECLNATDEGDAIVAALTQLSSDFGGSTDLNGSPLTRVDVVENDTSINYYVVRFTWNPLEARQTEDDGPRTEFDFGQETARRFYSFGTTTYGSAPSQDGAIGVERGQDGRLHVSGTEILSGAFTFGKRLILPLSSINDSFLANIASVYFHTNNSTFAGFAAGEVLFLGCSGAQRGSFDYEVCYRFAMRPNQSSLTVGSISGISADGWQEIEPFWGDVPDATYNIWAKEITGVYVHTVYPVGNLSSLGVD